MLIVPYTQGAAGPMQIVEACEGLTDLTFLVHERDERVAAFLPMLRELVPVLTHHGEMSQVLAEIAPLQPSGVVTFADSTMQLAAAIAEAYELPHNSSSTCQVLRSKLTQRQRLNDRGVGHVNTFEFMLEDPRSVAIPADAGFPAVIKPTEGAASRDTVLVQSRAELTAGIAELTPGQPYVFEEYIGGADIYDLDWLADYVSVESAVSGAEIGHLGITGRLPVVEPLREGGVIFPAQPAQPAATALTELAADAIRAVGITTGLVHTEVKMTPDGPQIIEVNGRLGGTMERLIPRALGVNPVRLAIEIALGAPLPADFGVPSRVTMMHYVLAPMAATAVVRMPSPAVMGALPGVFGMDRLSKDGEPVDWRTGSIGRICDMWIEADSLAELGRRYQAVVEALTESITWSYG